MEEGEYHKTGGFVYHIMASFAEVAIGILYRPKLRSHEASNAPPLMHFGSKHNIRYKGELIPINVADKVAVSFYKDCTPHRNGCPDQNSMVDPSFWIDDKEIFPGANARAISYTRQRTINQSDGYVTM